MLRIFQCIISIVILFISVNIEAQRKWTLEDCIEYSIQNNPEVLKQILRNEVLKRDITIAKGKFYPDANFSASQNFSLGNSFDVSTGVGQLESSSNSFSLSSSVPLFRGFTNKYNLERSKNTLGKGEADLKSLQFDLSLNIINKYLEVLFNKEIVRIAEEQVQISQDNFERVERLFKEGFAPKREFLELKSALANDKKESILSLNRFDKSLIELQEFLGAKDLTDFSVQEVQDQDLNSLMNPDKIIPVSAIENNPRIASSKTDIAIKKDEVNISKARFSPSLNLNYSYSSNYFHILGRDDVVFNQETGMFEENGFFTQLNNNRTHFISLTANIPIFNRFETKESYKKAEEELKISEIELENQKIQLRNKIRIAMNDLNSSQESLESSKEVLEAQRDAFSIAQKQYNNGGITNIEYLEVKTRLVESESEYIKAKYEVIFKDKVLQLYLNY